MPRKRKTENIEGGTSKRAGWCYGMHYSEEAPECDVCELKHTCRENTKLLEGSIDSKEEKNGGTDKNG